MNWISRNQPYSRTLTIFPPFARGAVFVPNIDVSVLELTHRQRIQGNEVSTISERKGDAEAANLINIAKKCGVRCCWMLF